MCIEYQIPGQLLWSEDLIQKCVAEALLGAADPTITSLLEYGSTFHYNMGNHFSSSI
jgi:hypothetical protein